MWAEDRVGGRGWGGAAKPSKSESCEKREELFGTWAAAAAHTTRVISRKKKALRWRRKKSTLQFLNRDPHLSQESEKKKEKGGAPLSLSLSLPLFLSQVHLPHSF